MLFEGKKGIVMGVANDHSIAAHIAKFLRSEGAELGFSHLPDQDERGKMSRRVRLVTDPLGATFVRPCDVSSDDSIESFFRSVADDFGHFDFLLHSIAYADVSDIRCPTLNASRSGFKLAMDISVYSLIAVSRAAQPILRDGGSVLTLSYLGAERVVPGYNMMGVCKAALEATTRYLAYDLGKHNIRVNALSAGPVKTLAASAIGDFSKMINQYAKTSPLGRCISGTDVSKSAAFLLSELSSGITGENLHVDGGYFVMAAGD